MFGGARGPSAFLLLAGAGGLLCSASLAWAQQPSGRASGGAAPLGATPSASDAASDAGTDVAADHAASAPSGAERRAAAGERGVTAEHGVRLGASVPFGQSSSGRSLADDVAVRAPIWVDIGFRPRRDLYFGAFGQVGLGAPGDHCRKAMVPAPAPACATDDWRIGVEALYSPLPPDALALWFGVGLGWEWQWQSSRAAVPVQKPDGTTATTVLAATELQDGPIVEVQAGIDFEVFETVRTGPFLSYAAGTYLYRAKCPPGVTCGWPSAIGDPAVHDWLTLGLRGTFGL